MIIDTCRNKQHGRTTPDTVFIYKHVSRWRFFRFDNPFKGKRDSAAMSPNLQKVWDFEVIPQLWGALENFLLVKTSKHGYLKCSLWFFLCVRKKINVIRHLSQKIFKKNVLKVSKKTPFSWIRKEKTRRGSLKGSELRAKLTFDSRSS